MRKNKRIYEDHTLTQVEKNRRHQDKISSIDNDLDPAIENIDTKRKSSCENDFIKFVNTYMVGLLLDDQPKDKMIDCMLEMANAVQQHRPYMIEIPRGMGKTTASQCLVLWLLAYAKRKFVVIVSANQRQSNQILDDIWRIVNEKDTAFANDFPEICLPYQLLNGSTRRRQLYKGVSTELQRNSTTFVFPRVEGSLTSKSVLMTKSLTGGIRGTKMGKLRPDFVICDDLQTSASASNPEQVEKIYDLINKDIFNLSSKGKISLLMTATPICAEDLCEKIESDKAWKVTKYKAIIKYPDDIEKDGGLWKKYFEIYDKENVLEKDHSESLQFYKDNFDEMNKGAEIFQNRYNPADGHISGLQALLEKKHTIGSDAFDAEMQMTVKKYDFALNITPKNVLAKIGRTKRLEVEDGYTFVCASSDLNVSFAVTTTLIAFKRDLTGTVIDHFVTPCRIPTTLNETEYNQRVHDILSKIGNKLKEYNIQINAWGIDAGGKNFNVVTNFVKVSKGIPACAMLGRASHMLNLFTRSRLREAIGRTILCGDSQEHIKANSGIKYMFFDSDVYREQAQRALLSPLYAQGSLSLYDGTPESHKDFAIQVTNEHIKLIKTRSDGRQEYYWTSKDPHDYLDTLAMDYAIAASQGIYQVANARPTVKKPIFRKKSIRIV